MIKNFVLNNSNEIPAIGFGTWQIDEGENAYQAVKTALEKGYTHIDTAAVYGNEVSVGKAIKDSGIARENLFVTTKLWNDMRGYENAKKAFQISLDKLGLEYIDLYLLHWPANETQFPEDWQKINEESWKALEDLQKEGKVKAIGVSNFMVNHLEALLENATVVPAVNQIEFHPGFTQPEVVELCKNNNILVQAWSPLGSGRILQDETLKLIAEKHNVSVGQVCIKFAIQQGVLPLPKSENPTNIENNLLVDFELSQEEIEQLSNLDETGFSGLNPGNINF
ncbi:aldo/keto reductase [Faecalibacter bovis]|uniref:Aldo/keto reductase n=1 Tax=Faecalibacter bovis TaxID=2898187 RepID=A0ABX7XD41_9FLAO|nr:aldo/keto reductase [Faecalibacter bovis]QTV05672.1 aldo/keto reductase [Faecalibacter bovis]